MISILPSQVAGIFYPDSKELLEKIINDFICDNTQSYAFAKPKALIVPHAGYIYSGNIAASAYAILENYSNDFDNIILFGPAHRSYIKGLALPSSDQLSTPLGTLEINKEICKVVQEEASQIDINDSHFYQEHCLEVQLPFLQYLLKNKFRITPVLVGDAKYDNIANIISELNLNNTLVIISSDLSHFHRYNEANAIDSKTNEAILNLDANSISYKQACGRIPIQGLLSFAKKRHIKPTLISMGNSGDTYGDKSKVVGYAAYHFA